MSSDPSSLKKVAILTGLIMIIGGARISEVDAATLMQLVDMPTIETDGAFSQSNSATVGFNQFNTGLGTLTDVQLSLTSDFSVDISAQGFNPSVSAMVKIDNVQIGPTGTALASLGGGDFSFGPTEAALSPPALSFYEGSGTFNISLLLNVVSSDVDAFVIWGSFVGEGLTLTYTYTSGVSATPLPAGLPLFATGVAGLGFTTWRSRRKQKAGKPS
jgi:hypothetical protein